MQAIKKVQMQTRDSKNVLDTIGIEKGISQVVSNLSRAKPKDFIEISYEALSAVSYTHLDVYKRQAFAVLRKLESRFLSTSSSK